MTAVHSFLHFTYDILSKREVKRKDDNAIDRQVNSVHNPWFRIWW